MAKKRRPRITVTPSSGNIFADLGFKNPERELARAQLASDIRSAIVARKLTPAKTATLLRIDQSEVSQLLDGRLANFTIVKLRRLKQFIRGIELLDSAHEALEHSRGQRSLRTTTLRLPPKQPSGRAVKRVRGALFNDLVTSIRQAGKIRRGTLPSSRAFTFHPDDIKTIRAKLKCSRSAFAHMIGVSVATLRNWEQGRRVPRGPARGLLMVVAAMRPKAVVSALGK